MIAFIDDHRDVYGVGSICRVLRIAPSTYYTHKQIEARPELASARVTTDARHEERLRVPSAGSALFAPTNMNRLAIRGWQPMKIRTEP